MAQNKSIILNTKTGWARALPARLWRLRRRVGSSWEGRLAVVMAVAALLAGFATYAAMNAMPPFGNNPDIVIWLLNLDLVILLTLAILIARRVVALFGLWRKRIPGSRLHVRLVYIFGLLALAPAIIMTVFSLFFFHYGVQSWFSDRVKTAVRESQQVAEAYLREHHQAIRADILAMANDLDREAPLISTNPDGYARYIRTQSVIRNLPEVLIIRDMRSLGDLKISPIIFRLGLEEFPVNQIVSNDTLSKADSGNVLILTDVDEDRVRALVKLRNIPNAFLLVGRMADAKVLNHLSATREAVQRYDEVAARYDDLRTTVTMFYLVVALLLLLASIWFGLVLARRIATPISDLISVSDRVREGDLTAVVNEKSGLEEFDYLAKSFNRMTSQLSNQQNELMDANRLLDQRRRFTETILAGVTSGVLGVDGQGKITTANAASSHLLKVEEGSLVGKNIQAVFKNLPTPLLSPTSKMAQFDITHYLKDGKKRTLLFRVVMELIGDQEQGAVITFDDITDLQSAQRKAAWSDVARRIAHEIKNPLTPIQLSAERLKRKYLKTIPENDQEIFSQCIDTIVRHVGDIGHMVNEFSSFARLPEAQLRPQNFVAIVEDIISLNQQGYRSIEILNQINPDLRSQLQGLICDEQQIRQAFTNILKNSIDSIEEKNLKLSAQNKNTELGKIRVFIKKDMTAQMLWLVVQDNGLGLPQDHDLESLTEPYVTFREKGTGLGLAIVKKIMEDHGGQIVFGLHSENSYPEGAEFYTGATVSLVLPLKFDLLSKVA
jgi:two-component system, NtrC family, nitrogen regulation sensor histidine kinase NtrY